MLTIFERSLTTTVNDIEHIESQAYNGVSVTRVYFQPNAKVEVALSQLTAIAQTIIRPFPPGTTPPSIIKYDASSVPILQLGLESPAMSEHEAARSIDAIIEASRAQERRLAAAGEPRRTPTFFLGFLAGEDGGTDEPASEPTERFRRQRPDPTLDERQSRPGVVGVERQGSEDLPAQPARSHAVARVAGAVVDSALGDRAEEREVVCRDVDRSAPGSFDARLGEPGQEEPQARFRPRIC